MDANDPPEIALAAGPAPAAPSAALPDGARWRRRRAGPRHGASSGATADVRARASSDAGVAFDNASTHASVDGRSAPAPAPVPAPVPVPAPAPVPVPVPDVDFEVDVDSDADPGAQAVPDTDAAEPQRAARDIELWLLARRAQGAALRLDFELRSVLARQVFRRDFVYVSRQLHALEASRRVQGLDRRSLDDALAALRRRADGVQAFLERQATALQSSIDARGPAGARIAFARPARFQATIVSPGAHRFLHLLMLADETLARLEMAWLLGLVEPASRSALVADCRRQLLGFKDLACERRHAVGQLVQGVNAQRREGLAMPPVV